MCLDTCPIDDGSVIGFHGTSKIIGCTTLMYTSSKFEHDWIHVLLFDSFGMIRTCIRTLVVIVRGGALRYSFNSMFRIEIFFFGRRSTLFAHDPTVTVHECARYSHATGFEIFSPTQTLTSDTSRLANPCGQKF
jgi:hypothetical protein